MWHADRRGRDVGASSVLCDVRTAERLQLMPVPPKSALRLPSILSDHMVLQAESSCRIWGWGSPCDPVEVQFSGQTVDTTVDAEGYWEVFLAPLPPSAEGRPMMVKSVEQILWVQDVIVGQVWLGSGQSNMAMRVAQCSDVDELLQTADCPQIRLFTVAWNGDWSPVRDVRGAWRIADATTVSWFSAVAYTFGRELNAHLGQPVGLINSSVGGSSGEAWLERKSLMEADSLKRLQDQVETLLREHPDVVERGNGYFRHWHHAFKEYWRSFKLWRNGTAANRGTAPAPPDSTVFNLATPSIFYHGMIAPLTGYSIRGVLWYQGERNANSEHAYEYRYLLPALIKGWRDAWGAPKMPFYFVQLPEFEASDKENSWAVMRESMLQTWQEDPYAGMVVTIGLGDPQEIHPVNKVPIGRRLAHCALERSYGVGLESSGPIYRQKKCIGSRLYLSFDHVSGGLVGEPLLKGFAIASESGDFVEAMARIEGSHVIVWSERVPIPAHVRYAWGNNVQPSLFNSAGLPASPFRTDTRDVTGEVLIEGICDDR